MEPETLQEQAKFWIQQRLHLMRWRELMLSQAGIRATLRAEVTSPYLLPEPLQAEVLKQMDAPPLRLSL